MAATIIGEPAVSRRGDSTSRDVKYLVGGTSDDTEAETVVAGSAPLVWSGLVLRGLSIDQLALEYWLVTAHYGEGQGLSQPTPTGSAEYEFSYQAPSEKIYQSLATISKNAAPGKAAIDFKGAINVKKGTSGLEVEGLDLPSGNATSTWVFYPEFITDAYEVYIESIMGTVNAFPFKNRPAGEMRFVSCSGGIKYGSRPTIRFGFQRSVNRSNFIVGGNITVPFKAGHHLTWAYYDDDADAVAKAPLKYPRCVYVEQVFPHIVWNLGF